MPELPQIKLKLHPAQQPRADAFLASSDPQCEFAELLCTSNFTFLTGASHPDELVQQAASLGYRALAITDTLTLAGIVRAHVAAKESGLQLIVGSRLTFTDPAPAKTPGF